MAFFTTSSICLKVILLQVILINVASSMVVDIDEYSRPSNENILTLFNKFLEEINKRRIFESSNNRVEQIKNVYDELPLMLPSHNRMIQTFEKSINSEKKNEKYLMPPLYQENSGYNNIGYDSSGKDKRRYETICHFKICNKK
ncbi:uncharacterized protein LOC126844321 [Adelges cooleyi]|uniref:uncharacterized protein LOC126844321 n=1 Tax=Adelges cooleyi TaxID=133065 RepID=UPI00217F292D|nr:uncharacterized protein LOC126844321 [Adelges cooleyi]